MINDDPSIIAPTLNQLKQNFLTQQTKDVKFRKQQLKQLIKGLKECEKEIHEAYQSDLGYKNIALTQLFNLTPTILGIEHAISSVHDWAKPRPVKTSLLVGNGKSKIIPEPYGVALVIGTWNYPLITSISPVAEAIAAGNCVCLKPSELAPKTSNIFRKIFEKYLDQRFYKVIEGAVNVAINITTHKWDLIIFTGSPQKGKLVAKAAAENLVPCILELGGKSPCIVDKCTNIDNAVTRIAAGKFTNCGQTCIAPDHLYVHEQIKDQFVDALKKKLNEFYGDNAEQSNDYNKIIASFHTERLGKMIDEVKSKVIHGGRYNVQDRFVEPTIVMNPSRDSTVMQEEIFGPILPIITYTDFQAEIYPHFGKNDKPLALYYFGKDQSIIKTLENETSSGSLVINDTVIQIASNEMPFGGVGVSGFQGLHGIYGFDACSHLKSVLHKDTYNGFPMHIRFPPYTKKKQSLTQFMTPYVHIQNEDLKAGIAFILVALIAIGFAYAKGSN